jgi:hypothetical protein
MIDKNGEIMRFLGFAEIEDDDGRSMAINIKVNLSGLSDPLIPLIDDIVLLSSSFAIIFRIVSSFIIRRSLSV